MLTTSPNAAGIKQFVAAAFAGETPPTWTTQQVTSDGETPTHILASFRASYDEAKSMGAEQAALEMLADLPGDVVVVQRVVDEPDFEGWRSTSRLPTPREEQLYQPGQVYQLLAPAIYDPAKDAEEDDPRGKTLTDDDILTAYGLEPLNG
jgi:hypothetical protein